MVTFFLISYHSTFDLVVNRHLSFGHDILVTYGQISDGRSEVRLIFYNCMMSFYLLLRSSDQYS